jgi:hypothetical protein
MKSGYMYIEVLLGGIILAFAVVASVQLLYGYANQTQMHNRSMAVQLKMQEIATEFQAKLPTKVLTNYTNLNITDNYLGAVYTITAQNYRTTLDLEAITLKGKFTDVTIMPQREFTLEATRIK